MKSTVLLAAMFCFACLSAARAQVPVELFAGHRRATVDIMFFKFINNKAGEASRFLFFNRNRASAAYQPDAEADPPQFGFTEALSYNHRAMKGFAPVAVAQVLGNGVLAKAGIQYARLGKQATVFSWLVCETTSGPVIDHFLMLRYTPKLTNETKLFVQFESLTVFPTGNAKAMAWVNRNRLGLQHGRWQWGAGADLVAGGPQVSGATANLGVFLRHEF